MSTYRNNPPTQAAAQALFELYGTYRPGDPLPLDEAAFAASNLKAAAHVAKRSTNVALLLHMATSDKRWTVTQALVSNPHLPADAARAVAPRFVEKARPGLWADALVSYSRVVLDALLDVADTPPAGGWPDAESFRALLSGYERAADLLPAPTNAHQHYLPGDAWIDPTVIRRLNAAGHHKWAEAVFSLALRYDHRCTYLEGEDIRAGLDSAIRAARRGHTPTLMGGRPIPIPTDLLPDILGSRPDMACRSLWDLPADMVASHAGSLLDKGWITQGKWRHMSNWTPEVQQAVAEALAKAPDAERVHTFASRLEGANSRVALAGVDEIPHRKWGSCFRGFVSGQWSLAGWWLHYSAGRPRTAGEAVEFIRAAWPKADRLAAPVFIHHFIVNPPEGWTDAQRAMVRSAFTECGEDPAVVASRDLNPYGAAAVLGDNVEAWKLFYGLLEEGSADVHASAQTALILTTDQ